MIAEVLQLSILLKTLFEPGEIGSRELRLGCWRLSGHGVEALAGTEERQKGLADGQSGKPRNRSKERNHDLQHLYV